MEGSTCKIYQNMVSGSKMPDDGVVFLSLDDVFFLWFCNGVPESNTGTALGKRGIDPGNS